MAIQARSHRLEQRILDRVTESTAVIGYTNEDWAKELGVSPATVKRALFRLKDRYAIRSYTRRFQIGGQWTASRQIWVREDL